MQDLTFAGFVPQSAQKCVRTVVRDPSEKQRRSLGSDVVLTSAAAFALAASARRSWGTIQPSGLPLLLRVLREICMQYS
jgi:hypothetical protein